MLAHGGCGTQEPLWDVGVSSHLAWLQAPGDAIHLPQTCAQSEERETARPSCMSLQSRSLQSQVPMRGATPATISRSMISRGRSQALWVAAGARGGKLLTAPILEHACALSPSVAVVTGPLPAMRTWGWSAHVGRSAVSVSFAVISITAVSSTVSLRTDNNVASERH